MYAMKNLFSRRVLCAFFSLILGSGLMACGQSYDDKEVKDYRLTVIDGTPQQNKMLRTMIDGYNRAAGFLAMRWVDDAEQANSAVILTKGLHDRDGKVGWGQWLSETEHDKNFALPGDTIERTTTYSMRLEFDLDYVESRFGSGDADKEYDVKKLFTHEVGHGLFLGHATDASDVMYYDISGQKDFDQHFEYVREYFGKN